jgi:hypothetical protein
LIYQFKLLGLKVLPIAAVRRFPVITKKRLFQNNRHNDDLAGGIIAPAKSE